MPTNEWSQENPRIAGYIPKEVHELLLKWMEKRRIKSVSSAVTVIMEEYFSVTHTNGSKASSRIDSLEASVDSLTEGVREIKQMVRILAAKKAMQDLAGLPIIDALNKMEFDDF